MGDLSSVHENVYSNLLNSVENSGNLVFWLGAVVTLHLQVIAFEEVIDFVLGSLAYRGKNVCEARMNHIAVRFWIYFWIDGNWIYG